MHQLIRRGHGEDRNLAEVYGACIAQRSLILLVLIQYSTLGSRDGAVVRVLACHPCVPGSILGPGVTYVGWVCCWFSTLLFRNQHLQLSVRPWNARTFLNKFVNSWVLRGKQTTLLFTHVASCSLVWHSNSTNLLSWVIRAFSGTCSIFERRIICNLCWVVHFDLLEGIWLIN